MVSLIIWILCHNKKSIAQPCPKRNNAPLNKKANKIVCEGKWAETGIGFYVPILTNEHLFNNFLKSVPSNVDI